MKTILFALILNILNCEYKIESDAGNKDQLTQSKILTTRKVKRDLNMGFDETFEEAFGDEFED